MRPANPPSVTVFGLGLMGRPMARVLAAAGFTVHGWNRTPPADSPDPRVAIAADLAGAAQAEVCLLMLADSTAVDELLTRLDPMLRPGQVVLDMGSSDPRRSVEHAARLAGRGIGWVDAPVSGGPEGARAGSLTIMAGGAVADVARVQPVLDALGGRVTRVGEAGAGHTAKVANQLIVGLVIEAVAEALALAERRGLDPRKLQQALAGGFADSRVLQLHGTRMIERAYVPGGKVTTQLKDLELARALAGECGLSLPHVESCIARYRALVAQGDGGLDHSALHKLFDKEVKGE